MFPSSFLFGTATSATQIEGHCDTSDWHAFAKQPGRVKNGDTPAVACDSWHRWRQDVALQTSLGMGAYRFGVEWARIEPRPGAIERPALEQYREMLGALRDAGIEPMITLHHFTLPQWLAEAGGVLSRDFPSRLASFARVVVGALGDLCRLWITVNEPNVLAANSYLLGVWPPAIKSPATAWRAQRRLLQAHDATYRALKEARGDARVGVAHHVRAIEPDRPSSLRDRAAALVFRRLFNDAFAEAACRHGTQDFFGINYYSRDLVRFSLRQEPRELFISRAIPMGAELSDLGWEIYPTGLGSVVREWARRSGLPVYVTENGIADRRDDRRGPFLERHLGQLEKAIDDGVDVRGYFHWSLLDNFEWAEGYEPRFGLVEVDYATLERTPRPSAQLYARIARNRTAEGTRGLLK